MGTSPASRSQQIPGTSLEGLIDPRFDQDSCGVGFVAQLSARPSHQILTSALTALGRLAHRGAVAADGKSSDGVGIMTEVPRAFLLRATGQLLQDDAPFAAGALFLPAENSGEEKARLEAALRAESLDLLCWRTVPVRRAQLGAEADSSLPLIAQALITARSGEMLNRRLYLARKRFERESRGTHICSLSASSLVYKALCAGRLLADFYPDLRDPGYATSFAVFHQRYATNALPSWHRAQPLRMLAHNGEINTIWGNRARMEARAATLPPECHPLLSPDGSDSTGLDEAVELLARNGRTVAEAVRMLLPPARADVDSPFMRYHADCVEPWDGPAALAFADERMVGVALDRNGLRPCRFFVTDDGLVVAGSEAGLVDLDPERLAESGRLGPGEMLAVDLDTHTVLNSCALLRRFDRDTNYDALLPNTPLEGVPAQPVCTPEQVQVLQLAYGFTKEDVKLVLQPMAADGKDAVWSMGDDTPPGSLARAPRPVYAYLRQRFAQVTNPPIDSLRESIVVQLHTRLGPWPHILDPKARIPGLSLRSPVLSLGQMEALRCSSHPLGRELKTTELPCFLRTGEGLEAAIERICAQATEHVDNGTQILILTDRQAAPDAVPVPMAMATGAVHIALVRAGIRTHTGLVIEAGDCRDLHHAAVLLGYGAGVLCPWLALESASLLASEGAEARMLSAFEQGLAKIMSKMGISVVDSYRGAHLFDCIGLAEEIVERCFRETPAPISGLGWDAVEAGLRQSYERARPAVAANAAAAAAGSAGGAAVEVAPATRAGAMDLPDFGAVRYRRAETAEWHAWQPQRVKALQGSVGSLRAGGGAAAATAPADTPLGILTGQGGSEQPPSSLRELLAVRGAGPAVGLQEVEPSEAIVSRFVSSAMSLGSLSPEAHSTITTAMNQLGARSNTGEGGEDPAVYTPGGGVRNPLDNKIKQLASGRFGVTAEYLSHALEIEIKIAQGSKPGEGGQLPSHKVTELIARLRHSQPGVALISPPPHHDIYSIEDLAQLIYDMKRVNPRAAVGVKLVSGCGVGTVAAGVAKACADYIVIAGNSGGTGASPLSSIKHAGNPWELGLAETQQVLVANGLRGRVRLRTDGGLQTARDVLIAAMLGADEFAFGTAVLVALGCDMARQCHLNTCPTGIATQRPELRAKFRGKPEHVVRFFLALAQDVRKALAELGLRSLGEAVGRTDLLEQVRETGGVNLNRMLRARATEAPTRAWAGARNDRPEAELPLEETWLKDAVASARRGEPFSATATITNGQRSFGARLGGQLALERLDRVAEPPLLHFKLRGVAGQSFGAFAVNGMRLELEGLANDFVGKGLSGGEIVLRAQGRVARESQHHVLLGNVALYGATGGSLFAGGRAGERFAVRNSGAAAVVEGVGDHGCEYMTGGTVVVLGHAGHNFGAGMTGGVAWVLDPAGCFVRERCFHVDYVTPEPFRAAPAEARETVYGLVKQHACKTQSTAARALLANWEVAAQGLLRLVPRPQA